MRDIFLGSLLNFNVPLLPRNFLPLYLASNSLIIGRVNPQTFDSNEDNKVLEKLPIYQIIAQIHRAVTFMYLAQRDLHIA